MRKVRPRTKKTQGVSLMAMSSDVLLVSEYTSIAYAPVYKEDMVGEVNIMMTLKGRYNKTTDRAFVKLAMSREDAHRFLETVAHSIMYSIENEKEFLETQLAVLNAQVTKLTAELGEEAPEVKFLMELVDGIHREKGSMEITSIDL